MELVKVLQSGFALIFVLSAIGIVAIMVRKMGENKISGFKLSPKRIRIKEIQSVDSKTKFLIAEKDDKEYFILKSENDSAILEVKEIKKTDEEQ